MNTRAPYHGAYRKIVLAFDIGTNYSAISYSILDPGHTPEIRGVTRFPGQERVGGDSKIPTIIYYNRKGEVEAVGAEAIRDGMQEKADDEGWTKAEQFKLHLHPKTASNSEINQSLPALPENKTVVDLFADFIHYLYACTRTYIQQAYEKGVVLWNSVESIDFVFSHPNGWEGAQQGQIRRAAIRAGLIPDTSAGHGRVYFVTKGEANLHFCIQNGVMTDNMKKGDGVLIVDAGESTVDFSAYAQNASSKGLSFAEIAPPQCCHLQGTNSVTNRARTFFQGWEDSLIHSTLGRDSAIGLLQGSKFSDDVNRITNYFDKTTKLVFRSVSEPQFIKFGSDGDKDPKLNIRSGQLKLLGTDVATFFEPSIISAIQVITEQCKDTRKPISSVFLVGEFAANDWLFTRLRDQLEYLGLTLCRPDSHVNRSVADGAVSFYLDHFSTTRVSKFWYGAQCFRIYDPQNKEHVQRLSSAYIGIDGKKHISGGFEIILEKNTQVSEYTEFTKAYIILSDDRSALKYLSVPVYCYRGSGVPRWWDVDTEMYSMLCHIEADVSALGMPLTTRKKLNSDQVYYQLDIRLSSRSV